ncbi:hypothetical protein SXANM310S_03509 [Streptomyces xanthochromogenes]
MRTRKLRIGLYADEAGLVWVRGLVDQAVRTRRLHRSRSARTLEVDIARFLQGGRLATAEMYDLLAEQWAIEHEGGDSGAREPVELRVSLVCSLRTWRVIRKEILRTLCPEGMEPHLCRVPWCTA